MPVHVLASARTALEATRGTAVPTATRLLYFTQATHNQDVATIEPVDSRGAYTKLYRAYPGVERNSVDVSGFVTFDDQVLIGQLAFGSVSAGTVTAGTAYSWSYTPNGTADTNRSVTMEFGYLDLLSTVGWRLPGLVCDEITYTYDKAGPVTWSGKFLTAQGATQITAFTGALSDRTEVVATGPQWSAYMDSSTLGSTLDSRIVKAQVTMKNGYTVRDGADGTRTGIELVKAERRDVQAKLTRYFNDKAELDNYLTKAQRLVRLQTMGGSVAGGTAQYTHRIDLGLVATDHKPVEVDGLLYAEITYHGEYHASVGTGSDISMYLVNSINSIS